MKLGQTEHPYTTDLDISSTGFWAKGFDERDQTFARLRQEAPVSWHRPTEVPFAHDQKGFWAVVKAEDISEISNQNTAFASGMGVSMDAVPFELAKTLSFFLTMDAPEHSRFRRLVSAAFTPRQIGKIKDQIHANAREIVGNLVGAGDVDFVSNCAAILPMRTVSDMVGVSAADRDAVAHAANVMVGRSDDEMGNPADTLGTLIAQRDFLHAVGADLAAYRRKNPGDDLMTNLVQAEIDGQRLTDSQIGSFLVLFSVAGNDTTKQTTTRTVMALDAFPEQRRWLMEDFDGRIGQASDEFVRYACPVIQFARTAVQDIEFGGQKIAAGDKVVMFYGSGNRDESVFERPAAFDLSRPKNPHVGFGGGGIHYCLGNGVAKTQLRALFGELLTQVPQLKIVGEPEYLKSNFINGVKHLPVRIS